MKKKSASAFPVVVYKGLENPSSLNLNIYLKTWRADLTAQTFPFQPCLNMHALSNKDDKLLQRNNKIKNDSDTSETQLVVKRTLNAAWNPGPTRYALFTDFEFQTSSVMKLHLFPGTGK